MAQCTHLYRTECRLQVRPGDPAWRKGCWQQCTTCKVWLSCNC